MCPADMRLHVDVYWLLRTRGVVSADGWLMMITWEAQLTTVVRVGSAGSWSVVSRASGRAPSSCIERHVYLSNPGSPLVVEEVVKQVGSVRVGVHALTAPRVSASIGELWL